MALERWGWSALGEPAEGEVLTADALAVALRAAFRADAADGLPPTEYVLHVGGVSVSALVVDRVLDVVPIGAGALPQPLRRGIPDVAPEAVLELEVGPPVFRDLLSGAVGASGARPVRAALGRSATGANARTTGGPSAAVTILAGEVEVLARFRRTFHIEPVGPVTDASTGAGGAEASVA